MQENNQFVTNFHDVTLKDPNGNIMDVNNLQNETLVTEKLKVGDIVKLKNVNYTVKVEYVDYNLPDGSFVNYAGTKVEEESKYLILFNQNNIESIIKKNQDMFYEL